MKYLWAFFIAFGNADNENYAIRLFNDVRLVSNYGTCDSTPECSLVVGRTYDTFFSETELLACLHGVSSKCKYTARVELRGKYFNFCEKKDSSYVLNLEDIALTFGSQPRDIDLDTSLVSFGYCGDMECGCELSLSYNKNPTICKPDTGIGCANGAHYKTIKGIEAKNFLESLYTEGEVEFSWIKNGKVCSAERWRFMQIDMSWKIDISGKLDDNKKNVSAPNSGLRSKRTNSFPPVGNTNRQESVTPATKLVESGNSEIDTVYINEKESVSSNIGDKENYAKLRFNNIKLVSQDPSCQSAGCSVVVDKPLYLYFSKIALLACLETVPSKCKYTARVELRGKYFDFCKSCSSSHVLNLEEIALPFGSLPRNSRIGGSASFGYCGFMNCGCHLSLSYRKTPTICTPVILPECANGTHYESKSFLQLESFVASLYTEEELEFSWVMQGSVCSTDDWRYIQLDMNWISEFSGKKTDVNRHHSELPSSSGGHIDGAPKTVSRDKRDAGSSYIDKKENYAKIQFNNIILVSQNPICLSTGCSVIVNKPVKSFFNKNDLLACLNSVSVDCEFTANVTLYGELYDFSEIRQSSVVVNLESITLPFGSRRPKDSQIIGMATFGFCGDSESGCDLSLQYHDKTSSCKPATRIDCHSKNRRYHRKRNTELEEFVQSLYSGKELEINLVKVKDFGLKEICWTDSWRYTHLNMNWKSEFSGKLDDVKINKDNRRVSREKGSIISNTFKREENYGSLLFNNIKLVSQNDICHSKGCSSVVDKPSDSFFNKTDLLACLKSVSVDCEFTANVTLYGEFYNFCNIGDSSMVVNLESITLPFGSRPEVSGIQGEAKFGFCGDIESGCDLSLQFRDKTSSSLDKSCILTTGRICPDERLGYHHKRNNELEEFVKSLYTAVESLDSAIELEVILVKEYFKRKEVCWTDPWRYMKLDMYWSSEFSGKLDDGKNIDALSNGVGIRSGISSSTIGQIENYGSLLFNNIKLVSQNPICHSKGCSSVVDKPSDLLFNKTDLLACLKSVSVDCEFTANVAVTGDFYSVCLIPESTSFIVNLENITLPFGSLPKDSQIKGMATFGFCGDIESACALELQYLDKTSSLMPLTELKCTNEKRHFRYKSDDELEEFVKSLYTDKKLKVNLVKGKEICSMETWRHIQIDMNWRSEFSGNIGASSGERIDGDQKIASRKARAAGSSDIGQKENYGSLLFNNITLVSQNDICHSKGCSSVVDKPSDSFFNKTDLLACLKSVSVDCEFTANVRVTGEFYNFCNIGDSSMVVNLENFTLPFGNRPKGEIKGDAKFGFCGDIEDACDLSLQFRDSTSSSLDKSCSLTTGVVCPPEKARYYLKENNELEEFVESLYTAEESLDSAIELEFKLVKEKSKGLNRVCRVENNWRYTQLDMYWESEFSGKLEDGKIGTDNRLVNYVSHEDGDFSSSKENYGILQFNNIKLLSQNPKCESANCSSVVNKPVKSFFNKNDLLACLNSVSLQCEFTANATVIGDFHNFFAIKESSFVVNLENITLPFGHLPDGHLPKDSGIQGEAVFGFCGVSQSGCHLSLQYLGNSTDNYKSIPLIQCPKEEKIAYYTSTKEELEEFVESLYYAADIELEVNLVKKSRKKRGENSSRYRNLQVCSTKAWRHVKVNMNWKSYFYGRDICLLSDTQVPVPVAQVPVTAPPVAQVPVTAPPAAQVLVPAPPAAQVLVPAPPAAQVLVPAPPVAVPGPPAAQVLVPAPGI